MVRFAARSWRMNRFPRKRVVQPSAWIGLFWSWPFWIGFLSLPGWDFISIHTSAEHSRQWSRCLRRIWRSWLSRSVIGDISLQPTKPTKPTMVDARIWISGLRVLRPGCFETFWKNIVIEALCSWKARHAAAAWKKVVYLGSPDSTVTNSDDATHVGCAPGSFHEFCNLCAAVSFCGSPTCGFWSNYLIVFVLEALAVCYCCCGDDHDNIEDGGRRRTRATTRTATTRRHQDDDDEDDDEDEDEDEWHFCFVDLLCHVVWGKAGPAETQNITE